MGSHIASHQLSCGLYVSGSPKPRKEWEPTMASHTVPYTGGDIPKELEKMFDIPLADSSSSAPSPPSSKSPPSSASVRSQLNSGPFGRRMEKKPSSAGPISQLPTGLITGPIRASGNGGGGSRSVYGSAVTSLEDEEVKAGFKTAWKIIWNLVWKRRALLGFVKSYPDADLRGTIDGQYVKVSGVVTCGSIPLESSYQRAPRCIYFSTELYEYKGWGCKSASPGHRCFSWGSAYSENYVADFYISDVQSGIRALVKAGHGVKVTPFVKTTTVVDVNKGNKELSPNFLGWLADRKLSGDDRKMRLNEGYIKEGSTVTVMGVVQRHDNEVMIVPPTRPISTACEWMRCLLPMYIDGLILFCEDDQDAHVISV